jgi:septum formation protein
VIGSDQVAELDGEILGQPGTAARAAAQLRRLAGREHRLLTAVCVVRAGDGQRREALDVHRLRLRELTDDQIARYLAQDRPLDCAGGYKIEGPGIALFEWIRGNDFTGVVGLPLTQVVALLAGLGVSLP